MYKTNTIEVYLANFTGGLSRVYCPIKLDLILLHKKRAARVVSAVSSSSGVLKRSSLIL